MFFGRFNVREHPRTISVLSERIDWLRLTHIKVARTFGVPFATKDHALFAPALAGRNLAAGLNIIFLSYQARDRGRQKLLKQMIAWFIGCWMLGAGGSDSYILMTTPGSDNLETHVKNMITGFAICYGLLRQSP